MKVSKSWLQELVDLKDLKEVERLLPLRTIATKEITDDFIELDMKGYNRADLLSMRGVAREIAAITSSEIKFEDLQVADHNLPKVQVSVEDEKLCPVYCVAKIEGLKNGPSNPKWVKKLTDSGMRAVNNIADVTNLVMLEFGQPLHAFDADKVKGAINVRMSRKGEKITTLDGKTKELSNDLLIADQTGPIGIAGVMGGKDSESSETTTTILLEAAIFDPISIRKTAQRHNLYSEASKRFQHGLTKTNLLQALSAAIKMYEEMGGKLTAISLVGDLEDKQKEVKLTQEKINSLIGVDIPSEDVKKYLLALGFEINEDTWEVIVPYWRLDINIEEDLIEEVARMYGYENIPPHELRGKLPEKIDQTLPNLIYDLKKKLADIGLTEVQTYSFYSSQVIENCKLKIEDLVHVANPISSETEYLRDMIWPNLVEVVAKNLKAGFKDIAIFEIGKVYTPSPKELYRLAIALMNEGANPLAELNKIIDGVNLSHPRGVLSRHRMLFHPNRVLENMAEVHPRILNKFGIDKRVAILEVEF